MTKSSILILENKGDSHEETEFIVILLLSVPHNYGGTQ